ncbi:MAG: magnesium transporter [Nanoarchaeota archaeon]
MRILGKTTIDKEFEEIYFSEFLAVTGGIIGGTLLLGLTESFNLIAGLFILFPGLLEMHGNIYGSLSARLSNLLLLGKLKKKEEISYFIKENVLASFFLLFFVSFVLGLISYLFVYFFLGTSNPVLILISLFSSILSSFIEIPMTIYTTFWIFKHKLDPEDIMGPYVTTFGDIISILSLVIITGVLA